LITPEYLKSLIKFDASDDKNIARLMFQLQEEGAAKIYNLLEQYGIALLADEVGMGKTIQALSVCAALWNNKPDARILILAPREEVAKNWMKEYTGFIHHHYRIADNNVKSITGNQPVKSMIFCTNLYDLVKKIQQDWGQLFIAKTTSFSFLTSQENPAEVLEAMGIKSTAVKNKAQKEFSQELNAAIARSLKKEIDAYTENVNPYFDLLIIDEAHYFRNTESESLRVQTAKEIFGHPDSYDNKPLAKKILLMTATPNHSSSENIKSILSFFTNKFQHDAYTNILKKICVRRFRRLGKDGHIKYQYRNEILSPSDFREDPLSEMFFGLYQHELAREYQNSKNTTNGRGSSRMMKYLEGLEFLSQEHRHKHEMVEPQKTSSSSQDFSVGTDAHLIKEISKKFNEIFGKHPRHPKYQKLVDDLTDKSDHTKTVIFVRRIASVNEIAKRIIENYDKRFSIRSTHASNFRVRFSRSKTTLFAMFFSPSADYIDCPYQNLESFRFKGKSDVPENYYSSALIYRLKNIKDRGIEKDIAGSLLTHLPENYGSSIKEGSIDTLFSIFWIVFKNDNQYEAAYINRIRDSYQSLSYYEKEALAHFIEKGTLLASKAIVWLYDIFRNISNGVTGESIETYRIFCNEVKKQLKHKQLYVQIQESILNFRIIYTKVFGINDDKSLINEGWENFNNMQPVYPYSADNGSQNVLKSFNTPFFPDILVATSVLQEGVNLQYFCNRMYHYGKAWTPGDNEQRIGRIDRMFGKIERMLDNQPGATLDIFYPYLQNNIDEQQLSCFILNKHKAEKVIDLGGSFQDSGYDHFMNEDNSAWKHFLRKPDQTIINDPYPVKKEDFKKISKINYPKPKAFSFDIYYQSIISAIKGIEEIQTEIYKIDHNGSVKLLVDPTLQNFRKQPVLIDITLDPIGSGWKKMAVYCLRMRTPLGPANKLKELRKRFYENKEIQSMYLPSIKLCLDTDSSLGINWGLYISTELPLYIYELEKNPLSEIEIQQSYRRLIACADKTEHDIFNRDLNKEELNLSAGTHQSIGLNRFRRKTHGTEAKTWTQIGEYLIKEIVKSSKQIHDTERSSFIFNHKNFYIKAIPVYNKMKYQVAFLHHDAHVEELELLEKHLCVSVG
jgi:superfamily II DNA or RNA helicase